jgi:DNA-binding NarL/FixJ family response regulator
VIRVALLVPSDALRIGLRHILESQANLRVIEEFVYPSQWDAVDQAVDVLVAAPLNAETLQELLHQPLPALLLLTSDPTDVQSLIESSLPVWGALPEDSSEEELTASVYALAEGLIVGAPSLLTRLRASSQPLSIGAMDPLEEPLTNRELEVLQLIAQGLANKQIALQLDISEHTVKFHLSSIYAKLGVTNRTEAVNAGVRRGLVTL